MANSQIEVFRNHIGGEWTTARSGETFDNVNPADTRDIVGRFQASSAEDARAAVDAAAAAFATWRTTPITRRASVLLEAANHLEAHAAEFAAELTREEGKPLSLAKDEFMRSAQTLRFYAIEGQTLGGETFPQDDPDMLVYTHREPLGVVTVISPWNFPVSIPARKIAPALITGNTVVGCAAERLPPGRSAAALRPAQGRAELHHRQRRPHRRHHHRVAARAGHLLHGFDRSRQAHSCERGTDDAHPDGTGRQEPADRDGRRRP